MEPVAVEWRRTYRDKMIESLKTAPTAGEAFQIAQALREVEKELTPIGEMKAVKANLTFADHGLIARMLNDLKHRLKTITGIRLSDRDGEYEIVIKAFGMLDVERILKQLTS